MHLFIPDPFTTTVDESDAYFLTGPNEGYNDVADNAGAWAAWLTWLDDPYTGNLYHYGHGGPNVLGIRPAQHRGVTAFQIAHTLNNGYTGGFLGWIWNDFVTGHPYHFVFLDGCQTANGDLPLAFGIEKQHNAPNYYTQNGTQPQAFMGWPVKETLTSTFQGYQFDQDHVDFVIHFFAYWSQPNTALRDAVAQSYATTHTNLFGPPPVIWGYDQLQWNPP